MVRREFLRVLGAAGVVGGVPSLLSKKVLAQKLVRYEVHGSGPFLFVGSPISAAAREGQSDPLASVRNGYLDRLASSYKVVLLDYPPMDDSQDIVDSFTPDHVCADILAVADAAGADRFAWYGYSWGGVVGLQLASKTNRVTVLVCGGWPPLGAPYQQMVGESEAIAAQGIPGMKIFVTYYRELKQWPEREAVSKLSCPRMTFAGADDVVITNGYTIRIGPAIAEHREELERMGWTVRLVDGYRHQLFTRPDIVVPLVRDFLDPILVRG